MINNQKIIGIICECNPFHLGHKRLISYAKKRGNVIIAIMSGNFVQRGEPSIFNKYIRTQNLLKNDVDIVIELPVEFVMSSAKYFARASINILHKLGFVDEIIFGSYINDISTLQNFSKIDISIPTAQNISYPKKISEIYKTNLSSNDILGIEYIRAINELKSNILPICIERKNDLPTATELRAKINKNITNNSFSNILNYKILSHYIKYKNFTNISCITNDISNAILKTAFDNSSFDGKALMLNTKNRTLANIKRIFFNIIFNIQKQDTALLQNGLNIQYIRILGIKKSSMFILKYIKIPYFLSYATSSYNNCIKNFPNFNFYTNISKNTHLQENSNITNNYQITNKSIITNIYASDLYCLLSNDTKNETTYPLLIEK